jgi:hypothetical protein
VRLLVSADGLPVLAEIADRLGQRLGVGVSISPGRHDGYHEYPSAFADALRPFLLEFSGVKG